MIDHYRRLRFGRAGRADLPGEVVVVGARSAFTIAASIVELESADCQRPSISLRLTGRLD
jgi:hypothetical protein